MPQSRIFWLGMHKILVHTELPRLRSLGFEVFNPPYLSSIKDQSANLDWDAEQVTTLSPEIFNKLANYNFFYNSISQEISEILNSYFDAVIVTINPAWLKEFLKCFNGKIIYRVYGQHYLLSQELINLKAMYNIVSRDDFWFVPHAIETARDEEPWLREREIVVPYCLSDDIFDYTDTWGNDSIKKQEIIITCPNIANPYFKEHYKFLKKEFNNDYYKFYGVQLSQIKDKQVVGTLDRKEMLACFKNSSGYLYTYSEGRVCYLPPIEMMVLGGPVIYLPDSLLDRYFNYNSPGRCVSTQEARFKSKRLIKCDKSFIDEIIASQTEVRSRYMPENVWPIFDSTFRELLKPKDTKIPWLNINTKYLQRNTRTNRIYVFLHFPGSPVVFREGQYAAYDGIPRVVRQIINVLVQQTNVEILITAYAHQVAGFNGYFRDAPHKERIKILCINPTEIVLRPEELEQRFSFKGQLKRLIKTKIKNLLKKIIPPAYRTRLRYYYHRLIMFTNKISIRSDNSEQKITWYVKQINKDENCTDVLIPHYYFFPEALNITKNIVLYLPDYMPHFFHGTGEFAANEGRHTAIGRKLAQKARKVFCNSYFTKSYLPVSRLKVAAEKIEVAYLPLLNKIYKKNDDSVTTIDKRILEKPYIFYPTRPHPNKNLAFLLRIFDNLVENGHDINLVLTSTLEHDPKAYKIFRSLKSAKRIIFLDIVTDEILTLLYRKAAVLCLTSLAEGNFPPQIYEALMYETPIVASRLEFITERIPKELLDAIVLCEANNLEAFINGCEYVLNNRDIVLEKQKGLLKSITNEDTITHFYDTVRQLFNLQREEEKYG